MTQVSERGRSAVTFAILLASPLMWGQQQPQVQRQDQQQQEWMAIQKVCGQLGPVLRPQDFSEQERTLVAKVFQRIIAPACHVAPYTTIGVVNSDVINAFTFPIPNQRGSIVCLTRGIINLMSN